MEKDEEKLLNRKRLEKWTKIFLVFLAFVWLCTIISKSIYVSGLTRVKTDTASKKYVEHIVETDGIVTTGGEIAVNTQPGLRVDRIYVRQGDEVQAGDVLFTIDLADLSEMIREKETELAKQQCNLSDLQTNTVIDAQKKEIALLWAIEDYETADKETAIAKDRAKAALEKAEAQLAKHLADPVPYTADSARRDEWNAYNNWVNRGYDISDRITAKEREIQALDEQLAELEKRSSGESEINVLSGAAGGQEDTLAETDNTGNNNGEAGTGDVDSTDDTNAGGIDTTSDNTNEAVDKEDLNPSDTNDTSMDNSKDSPDSADTNENDINTDAGEIHPEIDAEKLELQNKIRQAKQEITALQDEFTKHGREAVRQPDYAAEELEYDTWQNTKLTLEANVQSAKENYSDVSYAREVTLRQKMRDIASAQVTPTADSSAAVYELDINQTKTQLAKLYSIQKQKGEVKAQDDGVVSAIRVDVGGRTADTAAILLTDGQRPCQFKFSITKEQGKYVHLNDTVELKLNGQSAAMEVSVDYVTENAQGGYDAVCMLPEGVGQPGLSGNIQKTVQGEYHSLTLPADAVYEEQGGSYIFTLNEKEGILGSEYYVEKIKVQVKDRNDRYAALEAGTISTDTQVIIYSTKELKQGESVRPQDT